LQNSKANMKKTKMTTENAQSLTWGWKKFADEFLELYGKEKKQKKENPKGFIASIILSFLIIFIAAQTLGFAYNVVENQSLLEEYKGANIIVYSNIG